MTVFLTILVSLAIGFLMRRFHRLPEGTSAVLNAFIINLSLPALILVQVPALLGSTEISTALLAPALMAWLLLLLSYLVFTLIGKRFAWSRAKVGALTLTGGLGNTAFVGYPVVESMLGPEGLKIALVVDQVGGFFALSSLGLFFAATFSGRKVTVRDVTTRILKFPPFVSIVVGVAWYLSGTYGSGFTLSLFEKFAATLLPLAFVTVGFQLNVKFAVLRKRLFPLTLGLAFKLVFAPAILGLLFYWGFGARGLILHATMLQAAMAPMITAAVVSNDFHLDSEIANLMVGVGIPLSMVTLPIWNIVLQTLLY